MRQRGPDLLAVDDELVALADSRRAQARQIRTGTRLRVSLAPDMLAGENLRQVFRLLLFGAEPDQQRADQAEAMVRNARTAETAPFLDIDHVLGGRQAHAAILDRPDWRQPALFVQRMI